MDKGQGVERESGGNKMWRKLQVAKDGQGVYKSSKVRMKIAPSFLSVIYTIPTVWFYKQGLQIIVQHYIVNDAMGRF